MEEKIQNQFSNVKRFNHSMTNARTLFGVLKNSVNGQVKDDAWSETHPIHIQNSKTINAKDLIIGK